MSQKQIDEAYQRARKYRDKVFDSYSYNGNDASIPIEGDWLTWLAYTLVDLIEERDNYKSALESLNQVSSVELGAGTFIVRRICQEALKRGENDHINSDNR